MARQEQEPTMMQCMLIGLLTGVFGPMFLVFLALTTLMEVANNTRPVRDDDAFNLDKRRN